MHQRDRGLFKTNGTSPPVPAPAVLVEEASYSHNGSELALDRVSLSLPQGDSLAIIGPNGGGKTTLLRLILGLARPQSGKVSVFGSAPRSVSGRIGYVPQFSTLQPDFPASVLDMVLMGGARPSLRGGSWASNKTARDKAISYLGLLGLEHCVHKTIGVLSGGQRQRALVARALMGREDGSGAEPFLLLLDEPTASIDPQGKFCFYEFLGKLRGLVSIIVVSHDLLTASPLFTSAVFVNRRITPLNPNNALSPEVLAALFGQHKHDCPVGDLQHGGKALHEQGCTHPACLSAAKDGL